LKQVVLPAPFGDQRVDRPAANAQAHVLDGDEALELLGQSARFEDCVFCHACRLDLPFRMTKAPGLSRAPLRQP
jgi:hypothetical protein